MFSTNFNRNKHERATGHEQKNQNVEKLVIIHLICPTENCEESATTKCSTKRHLKNWKKISQNGRGMQTTKYENIVIKHF